MPVVTLLSDFGLVDTYVGQLKGAILAVAPNATLVDLTHAVPPQDIATGAFLLWSAVEVFPHGSVHVAVVDPGVGSARRGIAIRSGRGDVFVGPDNGLLPAAVERVGGASLAVELTERFYWRASVSSTFHARDIFGPVAGHLATGVPLERLGALVDDVQRTLHVPPSSAHEGQVVHVDTYGNLVTNLPGRVLGDHAHVRVGGHVAPAAGQYAAVASGALLALVGSAGLVEVAARDASAAALTGAVRGTPVRIEP